MRILRALALSLAVMIVAVGMVSAQDQPHTRTWVAPLSGEEEVPARPTEGHGAAVFHLSHDGTQLHYALMVSNIENVVAAHIHVGPPGENGPVVTFLYGAVPPDGGFSEGILSASTITANDLTGQLEGEPLSALINHIEAGNTYVNVHTNDGMDPANSGPGDFPGGEIRGQIVPAGMMAPPPMAATVAFDGQTLADQPIATQNTFRMVWGDQAAEQWVREHNAAHGH